MFNAVTKLMVGFGLNAEMNRQNKLRGIILQLIIATR